MKIIKSSGNVFADLGRPNAEELQLQAKLVYELHRLLERKRWTAAQTARTLGIPLPLATGLVNGDFVKAPVGELLQMLSKLNQRIEVHVTPLPRSGRRKATATL
ncbi:MAG: XRE family transcriptional regulator [Acidobacteria bacterium]|nr:XRE family transcriptional regulator [Acidobacteriota bacterium]